MNDKEKNNLYLSIVTDAVCKYYNWKKPVRIKMLNIHRNLYSIVHEMHVAKKGLGYKLWIKLPYSNDDNRDEIIRRIRTEFEVLEKLSKRFCFATNLGVVKPIVILENPIAIITEDVPGKTVQEAIMKGGRIPFANCRTSELETVCRLCGEWLKIFHDETMLDVKEIDWEQISHYCLIRLHKLKAIDACEFNMKFMDAVEHRLKEYIEKARSIPINVSGRHGDFAGHNMILGDKGGIFVLDFSLFDYHPIAFDYYNFIDSLEEMGANILFSSSIIPKLVSAFSAGYEGDFSQHEILKKIIYCNIGLAKLLTINEFRKRNLFQRYLFKSRERYYRDVVKEFAFVDI